MYLKINRKFISYTSASRAIASSGAVTRKGPSQYEIPSDVKCHSLSFIPIDGMTFMNSEINDQFTRPIYSV